MWFCDIRWVFQIASHFATKLRGCTIMVHSDFIAVHRSTSVDASLSQRLCTLRIFVPVTWVATQKTSVGRRWPMHNDRSLNAPYMAIHTDIQLKFSSVCIYVRMISYGLTFITLVAKIQNFVAFSAFFLRIANLIKN